MRHLIVSFSILILLNLASIANADPLIVSVLLDVSATSATDSDSQTSMSFGSEMANALFNVGPGDTYESSANASASFAGGTLTVSAGTSTSSGSGMLPVGFEDVFSSATASVDFDLDVPHLVMGSALSSVAGAGADSIAEFIDLSDMTPAVLTDGVRGVGSYRLVATSDAAVLANDEMNLAAATRGLTFIAVPEPGSALVLVTLGFAAMARRWRVRKI